VPAVGEARYAVAREAGATRLVTNP